MITYEQAKAIVIGEDKKRTELKDKAIKAANKKLIGTCYKYRNSYGGSDPGWWLYTKIIGVDGTSVITHQFQHTTYKIEITREPHSCYNEAGLGYGYQSCSREEYNKATKQIMRDFIKVSRSD
mgnify:CR=1 FL=1